MNQDAIPTRAAKDGGAPTSGVVLDSTRRAVAPEARQLTRAGLRQIIEAAIRDEARRGNHGYDDLARSVMRALARNRVIPEADESVQRVRLS